MRVGVDLGGTKTEAIVMDREGAILARRRISTPADYDGALAAMADLVAAVEADAGVRACPVGVGTPGSVSPATGLMRNSNSLWLNGRAFREDFAAVSGRPVRVANDANCFALSEAVDGAGAGAAVVFGVIAGTGCGGGVCVHGRLMEGVGAVAGEWGHTPLPWATEEETPPPECWCGRRGCLETWISGTGFARQAAARLGRTLSAEAIVALAETGEEAALSAMDALYDRMARGLAVVIDILDPDVIVMGGGLSKIAALYPGVAVRIPNYVFADAWCGRIVPAVHGDSSGVRGAAWLWRPDEL